MTEDNQTPEAIDESIEGTPEEIREAQKYRKRAQEAEGERDTLRTQLEQLQRTVLDTEISKHKIKAEAVFATGGTVEDLFTDGIPDADKIKTAVEHARTTLGLAAPLKVASDGSGGNRGDDIEARPIDEPTWNSALRTR